MGENNQKSPTYSKLHALEDCLRLWKPLAKSGDPIKPAVDTIVGRSLCPCCTYVKQFHEERKSGKLLEIWCVDCPLYSFWGDEGQLYCGDEDSYYDLWCNASESWERKTYSQAIVESTEFALKELNNE